MSGQASEAAHTPSYWAPRRAFFEELYAKQLDIFRAQQKPMHISAVRRLTALNGADVVRDVVCTRFFTKPIDVEQFAALLLQRLGRRHICGNHHFLDQTVGLQALGHMNVTHQSFLIEQDLSFWQVEVERSTLVAGRGHSRIGIPEGPQDGIEQRASLVVGIAVDCRLGLLVGQFGGRAHENAVEAVTLLAAVSTEHHTYGEGRAGHTFLERAQLVGNALGQHGDDTVWKIDRIAAQIGLAIERRTGLHIGRYVGDGDRNDIATLVFLVIVGGGVDCVVVVLGVCRINGDEGQVAPIFAALEGGFPSLFCFADHALRKDMGNFEVVDGDQRDGAFRMRIANDRGDAGTRNHQAAGEFYLHFHQIAIVGLAEVAHGDAHFLLFAVHRDQAGAVFILADDTDMGATWLVEHLHRLGRVVRNRVFSGIYPGQNAVSGGGNDAGMRANKHPNARHFAFFRVPLRREGMQVVGVSVAGNIEHRDMRQGGSSTERLASACDDTFTFELSQHGLEGTSHITANTEDFGQVAFALDIVFLGQCLEQLFARGEPIGHGQARAFGTGGVLWFWGFGHE